MAESKDASGKDPLGNFAWTASGSAECRAHNAGRRNRALSASIGDANNRH
jgi:hypothetical protein